ncbi:hypothetical protein [Faecalimonas umbilicata]|uniref:hypothetical protein n=1 Tax=Faecalimonas umbilicata TaxID=1912855 RepID=UPI0022E3F818|nr:hypothetical protein [Faecalimonas umbilicata]
MLKMVDGTGIIGVDMICPLGGIVSPPQPPNYDNIEMEGVGSLMLPNSLKAPLERVELIGNSVQGENPAPDNPQEIKSAGRKSKNLFNKNAVKQGYEFGSMVTDTETVKQGWFVSDFMPVKATTYQISGKKTGNGCKLYSKDKVFVKNIQAPFGGIKFDDGIAYFRINGEIKDLDKIQVEEGTVATDYEPYGYLLDVKVTGKNLLDMADIQNENGKIDSDFSKAKSIKPFKVIKDRKYLLISKGAMIVDVRYSSIYFGEDDLAYGQDSSRKLTTGTGYSCFIGTETRKILVAKETCTITKTMMHGTRTEKDAYEVEELGLFEIINDNPNIDYKPYTEQSMQIALNEPLRGIGEYKDTITKDGVMRKIKRIVFDGSEDEKWGIGIERENVIDFVSTQFSDATKINEHQRSMMDKLKWSSGVWGRDEIGQDMFARILRINMPKTLTPDLQTFKTWLSQNPLTVDYVLAEPVTEPLPEFVQAQLQALHSENGATHVLVESGEVPCGIKLTYRKEI